MFVVSSVARPFQMKQAQSGGGLFHNKRIKGFNFVANSPLHRKKSARDQYWGPKLENYSLCREVVLRFQRSRLYKTEVQI